MQAEITEHADKYSRGVWVRGRSSTNEEQPRHQQLAAT